MKSPAPAGLFTGKACLRMDDEHGNVRIEGLLVTNETVRLCNPNGGTGGERLDQLEPDVFKYVITWREIKA